MKNYSDLLVTDITVRCVLELIGNPNYTVQIGRSTFNCSEMLLDHPISEPLVITVTLSNKDYELSETAVKIKELTVDGIDILKYNYLATYENDHNYSDPTSYIGFNGAWTLNTARPFYQWLHQVSGQGWLLS